MDYDHDMGNGSEFVPASPPQFPSSQWHTQEADGDLVKWQSSQTSSVALNALMVEAAKPIRRSPRNHRSQQMRTETIPALSFSDSSGSSSASTSGSNSSRFRATRPRTRHPSAQIVPTSFLASTPASSISTDPTQFLQTLKGVSEKVKVDESARAKKRLFTGEVKGAGSTSTSVRHGKEKENLRRSTTGVKDSDKSKTPVVGSRSLPLIGDGGMDDHGDMKVDGSTSFQMEVDMGIGFEPSDRQSHSPHSGHAIASTSTCESHTKHNFPNSRSHMPPPPVPVPKVKPQPPPRDYPKPTRSTPNPVPISPKPKSAPQHAPPLPTNTHPQSRPLPSPHPSQQPPVSRPPNSQLSSRPPALGMRRSLSTTSALAPSQTLPEKRRGFKVPLAKPAPVHVLAVPSPGPSYRQMNAEVSRVLPTPEPSPPYPEVAGDRDGGGANTQHNSSSPAPDGDSSYGDMSFDMDALEEAMKKYD